MKRLRNSVAVQHNAWSNPGPSGVAAKSAEQSRHRVRHSTMALASTSHVARDGGDHVLAADPTLSTADTSELALCLRYLSCATFTF